MKLAARAAKQNYDLVIAYGGDGTINKVINGVINAKGHSIVGVIPGGTANEWAVEIGLPLDPMHSALTLVNSDARTIDLGHMQVQGLTFPSSMQRASDQQPAPAKGKKIRKKQAKVPSKGKPRFLLMAGLGSDAAILPYISKSFKYQAGSLAFEVAVAKKLAELDYKVTAVARNEQRLKELLDEIGPQHEVMTTDLTDAGEDHDAADAQRDRVN